MRLKRISVKTEQQQTQSIMHMAVPLQGLSASLLNSKEPQKTAHVCLWLNLRRNYVLVLGNQQSDLRGLPCSAASPLSDAEFWHRGKAVSPSEGPVSAAGMGAMSRSSTARRAGSP